MAERIEFLLGPSRLLGIFLIIIYLSTLIVLLTLPMSHFIKIPIAIFLARQFLQLWALHVRRIAKNSVIEIWQDSQGGWGCKTQHGHSAKGKLKGDSFKSHWLIILRLGLKNRTQNIVIPVDALTSFQYRRLCARLNFFGN